MTDPGFERRIALPLTGAALLDNSPDGAVAIMLVLPGGLCRADRYRWLGVLDCRLVILDGALSSGCRPAAGGPAPALQELAEAIDHLSESGLPVHVVGHSAGAAAILDALDPPANPAAHLPRDWALRCLPASVTILGCSLQGEVLDMVLPHRHEDRPLYRPPGMPLLFIAGDRDAMAPPALVRKTCERYTPRAPLLVMRHATHYGWAGPREAGDNPRSDGDPGMDTTSQRLRTLDGLSAMMAGRLPEPSAGDDLEI